MTALARTWESFTEDVIAVVDRLVAEVVVPRAWVKSENGSLVSDLDILIDVAVRRSFSKWFDGAAVLSEELGWMRASAEGRYAHIVGVLDPIDGTESLIRRDRTWWVSIGIIDEGVPSFGLLHQPVSGTTLNSSSVEPGQLRQEMVVGVSPDHVAQGECLSQLLGAAGFELSARPHSAEKVAAVIRGRCSSAVFVPSAKSPRWRSWDLAAALPIARRAGLLLTTSDGSPLSLDDLDRPHHEPWICSRDHREHQLLVSVLAPR